MKFQVLLAGSIFIFAGARAQVTGAPVVIRFVTEGYVTRVTSPADFDVNGFRVLCDDTRPAQKIPSSPGGRAGCPSGPVYLGESMAITGARDSKKHTFDAQEIQENPMPKDDISGQAVIVAIPSQSATARGELLVRADGYRIHIDPKTSVAFAAPLAALADTKPGDWIKYKGKRNPDGSISAISVEISMDTPNSEEEHLRKKTDFDPATASKGHEQSEASMRIFGVRSKRMPPHDDPAMQARVTKIGQSLIPAYQRNLPDSDPAKIHFRFEVVDSHIWWDALTMPSGLILVPAQVVERMQNDSQLAAVLADNIAAALESQDYRARGTVYAVSSASDAAIIAGIFVPGLTLAGLTASQGGFVSIVTKAQEQSGRVALGLMHDAGYDIRQAPLAWWLLGKKKAEPITSISLPPRAAYLYRIIGENWRNCIVTGSPTRATTTVQSRP